MKYITLTTDEHILLDKENSITNMYMKGNTSSKIKDILFLKNIKLEYDTPTKISEEIFNLIDKIIK